MSGAETSKPAPGTPEHDAAMAAKFDARGGVVAAPAPAPEAKPAPEPEKKAESPAAPAKPEHVPEKFWDAKTGTVNYEAWAKSTVEAERRITELSSKAKPADGEKKAEGDPKPAEGEKKADGEQKPAEGDPEAGKKLEAKGLQMSDFEAEFIKTGTLSAESYEKLAAAGFDKATVDTHIEGRKALIAQRDEKIVSVLGENGREQFGKMAAWAAANLSVEERVAFNETLSKGSVESAQLALQGLQQRYEKANGKPPALLGGQPATGAVGTFASVREMTAAMKDPRYKTDPVYRAEVERKAMASNL